MVRRTDRDDPTESLERFAAMPPSHPGRVVLRDELAATFLPVARHVALRFARVVRYRPDKPADQADDLAAVLALAAPA